MFILNAALVTIFAIRGAPLRVPSLAAQTAIGAFSVPEIARAVKADLESISGTGTVSVSVDGRTRFSARIAIPAFNSQICSQIYARERELHQLLPDLDFDFYFSGPELARAIKADLESISGPDTVDVSIDSATLFSVRIGMPGSSSEIYDRIFGRELEFYRVFRDLNFDFYLRPNPIAPDRPPLP